ncbi:MAG: HD-GYP domain-containing protein [Synergistaceae bacterium]|jgi:putative nucleotidyltransferase with HDIG domain|nr:HD-GYP domain-containing protein [Synergistaceae bacterium]
MLRDLLGPEAITEESMTDEKQEAVTTIKVPVDRLIDTQGIVVGDITSKKGAVILPAGVDISLFDSSIEVIIKKLKQEGIIHVHLRVPQQLSESDINNIIERVYSDGSELISKEKAVTVIQNVGNMFRHVREGDISAEITTTASSMSADLTEDLIRNPQVAFSLGKVQEADEYTFVHSFNVAVLTGYLTNRLHPNDRDYLQRVIMGSLLHDMGKARIPLEILNKPGPLSNDEFDVMKKHPNLGVAMALKSGIKDPLIIDIIGGHHEKWSGKGYPKGLKALEIPESARLAAVSDVFDALTAKRVYKSSMSSRNALTMILKDSGAHFDARVARELLVSLGLYPPGSIVALSDGRVGFVVSGGGKDLVRPVILIQEKDKAGQDTDVPVFLDLKTTNNICIAHYLGHSDKRSLDYKVA